MGTGLHLTIGVDPAGPCGIVCVDPGDTCRARVRARAVALPYARNCVEHIRIDVGLERLPRSEAVALLRECRRILKPDGRLTVGALCVHPALTGRAGDAGGGSTRAVPHGRSSGSEILTRRLRGCQWIGSRIELRELARQVGLACLTAGADEGDNTGRLFLELTKRFPLYATSRPLVSVLIPAFKPRFFAEAVESVLSQKYDALELVICDDCPTAEIQEIVERYAGDPRIRYVRNESTLGSRQNHIRCLSLASGELIKFLSDDDRLHPACVDRMAACLVAFPDVTLVTSHRQCIDEAGGALADVDATVRPVSEDSRIDGAALARVVLSQRLNSIGEPSTTMFRKQDIVETAPDLFSLNGRQYQTIGDIVMWLNLLSRGDAIYLAETLSYFRLHQDQEQRSEHVRSTGERFWLHARLDAARMGLLPDDTVTLAHWIPLGTERPWWPQSVAVAVREAIARTAEGEDAGRDSLRRAHDLLPDDPWLLVLLARIARQSGDLDAACHHLMLASTIAPALPCVHSELAVVMHCVEHFAEAEASASHALTLNPSDEVAAAVLTTLRGVPSHGSAPEQAPADPELCGHLDCWPAPSQLIGGLIDIHGWVVSRLPGAVDIRVLVDGCAWPAWVTPLSGPDVVHAFASSPPCNPRPRFALTLDTRTIPDGRHVLTFVATCDGRAIILGERAVIIRNRELLGVADGPAGELIDELVRGRDAQRQELEARLEALAREREAQRAAFERQLDALRRAGRAERFELDSRLEAVANARAAERSELEGRLAAVIRERDEAAAYLHRINHTWPVRLYARAVRLRGASSLIRLIAGVRS